MLQKKEFKYCGFGLKIASEVEFPELYPCFFDDADVCIREGKIPVLSQKKVFRTEAFTCILGDNHVFFELQSGANFFVHNGLDIIVEPATSLSTDKYLRSFLLSYPIMAILWQRSLMPLHASAILHNNQVVCIAGNSGAGKSTSVAGLSKKGFKVFSDDVVVINSSLKASTTYPMIRLWQDTQEKLNDKVFHNRLYTVREGLGKYGIFFHQNFDTGAYTIKKIIILKKGDVTTIGIKKLHDAEAFLAVRRHVYRHIFVHNNELTAMAFRTVSNVVNTCQIYQVTRPADCDIDLLANEIEKLVA